MYQWTYLIRVVDASHQPLGVPPHITVDILSSLVILSSDSSKLKVYTNGARPGPRVVLGDFPSGTMLLGLEHLSNLVGVADGFPHTGFFPCGGLSVFVQTPDDKVENAFILEGETGECRPVQADDNDTELISLDGLANNLLLEMQVGLGITLVKTLEKAGKLSPIFMSLHQAQCFLQQWLSCWDVISSVDVLEFNLFVSESGVCRSVFEFGLEFITKDEMALALVQICRNEVVASKARNDIV